MTPAHPVIKSGNTFTWTEQPGDHYLITGIRRDGRRFRMRFDTFQHARSINIWKGNRWLVRNGRRHLIGSVSN